MHCKNCDSTLNESTHFCSKCGAKVIRNRLTPKNLFVDFNERFFNYDNKFLNTFVHLFTKPEEVIGGYINGTRKKHVDAISYFAIAITVAGLQMFIINKFFPDAFDFSSFSSKEQEAIQKQTLSLVKEYQSIIMMFYIPFYALMSKLTFYKSKKYNYTEHLVIFMYIQAQITIAGFLFLFFLVLGLPFILYSIFLAPIMLLYSAYCLKRLYSLSLKQILFKILVFSFVFIVCAFLLTLVFIIIFYLSGGYDEIIEAAKAKKALAH